MKTENLSTLKIHKLTQEQYDRELSAGRIDESAIYLTPDEEVDFDVYATKEEMNAAIVVLDERLSNSISDLRSTVTVDATSGAKSIALTAASSNTEYRYVYASGITSLALSTSEIFDNNVEAYYSVIFKSGTTATTITNTLRAFFSGDDCTNGAFTPSANKTYDVGIYWNGLSWQAVVRGV